MRQDTKGSMQQYGTPEWMRKSSQHWTSQPIMFLVAGLPARVRQRARARAGRGRRGA
jgi:hypothetical protein